MPRGADGVIFEGLGTLHGGSLSERCRKTRCPPGRRTSCMLGLAKEFQAIPMTKVRVKPGPACHSSARWTNAAFVKERPQTATAYSKRDHRQRRKSAGGLRFVHFRELSRFAAEHYTENSPVSKLKRVAAHPYTHQRRRRLFGFPTSLGVAARGTASINRKQPTGGSARPCLFRKYMSISISG